MFLSEASRISLDAGMASLTDLWKANGAWASSTAIKRRIFGAGCLWQNRAKAGGVVPLQGRNATCVLGIVLGTKKGLTVFLP